MGSTSHSGSGFDRGHNCPSADRTGLVADNTATFLMSNMMPQAPTNNQQTRAGLENYARTLVALPMGTGDTSRVTTSTRVIAVNMPNTNSIGTAWVAYRTTVDAVEAATGYDILPAVSTTVQSTIESKVDTGPTS